MAVITLKELVSLNRQRSSPLADFQPSELSTQQQQFQLLVRQKRMGLNIEPLLNLQLALWLEQLANLIPGIFEPRKKIYLGSRWKAQLQIGEANYWLEVPINAGVVKNKVRLYEWRIGSAELNWSDRVKLWVACRYLQYRPEDLWMIICTFSLEDNDREPSPAFDAHGCPPSRINALHHLKKFCWDNKDYHAVEQELKSLLTQDTSKVFLERVNKYPNYIIMAKV
jgi:hypothetical protein